MPRYLTTLSYQNPRGSLAMLTWYRIRSGRSIWMLNHLPILLQSYFLKIWAELLAFLFLDEQQWQKSLGSCGTTVVLITWAGSVSAYEYFNMGELKKEFDNATCPQSLALILSIYFASQIEFLIKKGMVETILVAATFLLLFPSFTVSLLLSLFQSPSLITESQLGVSLSLSK